MRAIRAHLLLNHRRNFGAPVLCNDPSLHRFWARLGQSCAVAGALHYGLHCPVSRKAGVQEPAVLVMGRTPCLWWPDCIPKLRVDVDRGRVKNVCQVPLTPLEVASAPSSACGWWGRVLSWQTFLTLPRSTSTLNFRMQSGHQRQGVRPIISTCACVRVYVPRGTPAQTVAPRVGKMGTDQNSARVDLGAYFVRVATCLIQVFHQ